MKQLNQWGLALSALILVCAGCSTPGWEAEETDWKKDELAGRVRSVKEVRHVYVGQADGNSTLKPAEERLTEYDEAGYTVRTALSTFLWPSEDEGLTTYTRGQGGRQVLVTFTPTDGKREARVETEYDEAGRRLRIREYKNGEEVARADYTYDAQGRWVAYEAWDGDHVRFTYSYNAQGQKVRKETWQEDVPVEYTLLEYDARGDCTEQRDYNPDSDTLLMRRVSKYDAQHRTVEFAQYDAGGQEIQWVSFTYNQQGHRASQKERYQGRLTSAYAYKYEYDAQGNWTRMDVVHLGDGDEQLDLSERVVRKLTYH